MKVVRALSGASLRPLKSIFDMHSGAVVRLKNLLVAATISFLLFLAALLDPIDQLSWVLQSKLVDRPPSGDIVFVGTEKDLADPNLPSRRLELAEALTELEREGVGKVYIDLVISDPSISPAADEQLSEAIAALGPRAVLVDRIDFSNDPEGETITTLDQLSAGTKRVFTERSSNWMGFAWSREYGFDLGGRRVPSFAASLAGIDDARQGNFEIDYSIPSEKIETIDLTQLADGQSSRAFSGLTVVIGAEPGLGEIHQRIPGKFSVPYSYVAIFGAETLKAGRTGHIEALSALAIFTLLFAAMLISTGKANRRHLGYAALALALPFSLYCGALVGVRMDLSYCATLVIVFAGLRSRTRWKDRAALVDNETGLPKLRALELETSQDIHARGHLVVARVHGYEHVLKTLPRSQRAQYILKLVDRLRATDDELAIYSEGHHLAWHSQEDDSAVLAEHLEGLRAMFAAPVNVSGSSVDVGISFGVAKLDGDPTARLAAAVAAAEESSEALQPIKIAESSSRFDELWDISLRARIDEAMSAGEIFCVYQPKIDTRTGAMTGVEALVRWQDPARGFIPPMHFIAQCEKAGRMEALTDYVFEHACAAARLMHFRGRSITMSVNISATLLSDMRIVGMVRNVLQATGFDPRFLVLEVTETSRIGNLETAELVLNELRGLGAKISMDDFGVGETNFETFFELPFDEVKIDRLFIANMAKSAKAKAIVASIVRMGQDARIGVVAEGAEDEETLKILTEIGCTHVQGYVLARPMSLENLMEFSNLEPGDVKKA